MENWWDLVGAMLWISLAGSLLLTWVGLAGRSWRLLGGAAGFSLVFSILGAWSVGPFTFLLTCLQLAAVVAVRWRVSGRRWLGLLGLGLVAWVVVVPVQLLAGVYWLSWLIAFPLVAAGFLVLAGGAEVFTRREDHEPR